MKVKTPCVWPAGKILDRLLMEQRPLVVLELGAHCGYSSVRIARALPLGGRLYSVEMDQGNADITEKVLRLAGFDDDTVRGGAYPTCVEAWLENKCQLLFCPEGGAHCQPIRRGHPKTKSGVWSGEGRLCFYGPLEKVLRP